MLHCNKTTCVISGFCHDVHEICALLGCYAVQSGNSMLMFWGNLSVPSSTVKKFLNPRRVHISQLYIITEAYVW